MMPHLKRLDSIRANLKEKSLDAVLIEDPIDLYYITGLALSLGQLWITANRALLFVDGRYQEVASRQSLVKVANLSKEEILSFVQGNAIQRVAFDGDKTFFAKWQERSLSYPFVDWYPWNGLTKMVRLLKDPEEVQKLQASADLLMEGYKHIITLLKEGVTEKEISCAFTCFCLERGATGVSFAPIIAFGENSAMPHYRAGERCLQKNDVILIDIGIELQYYHSDMTRVLFWGEADPELDLWLTITKKAQQAALTLCKPGTTFGELDKAARDVFAKEGLEKYFLHSLGHGLGLEVHEFPRIRSETIDASVLLEPGMVFTVEPGLYKPGLGGVRYEDTIVITDKGYYNFTASLA